MKIKFVDTSNFKLIQKILRDASEEPRLEFVIGDPGIGKTVAFKNYCNNNPFSFYSEMRPGESGKEFFSKLSYQFKFGINRDYVAPEYGISRNHQIGCASSYLINELQCKVLIIDEVGNFKKSMIKLIRQLSDDLENKCSVIIAAPKYQREIFEDWERLKVQGISEFLSRIESHHEISKHTAHDIKMLCELNGVNDERVWERIWVEAVSLRKAVHLLKKHLNDKSQI